MSRRKINQTVGILLLIALGLVLAWLVWKFYDAELDKIDSAIEKLNKKQI
ncbi:MAG TPA: hypothetical protein VKX34_04155 [Aequorivita sp.]|nr:hypothetical protein [Aequorivita sp.]